MIQISNLQKKFGEKTAVNIDNYLINQGDMLGLGWEQRSRKDHPFPAGIGFVASRPRKGHHQ